MSALVVYESMYGNTRHIAEAIAAELPDGRAVPVPEATPELVAAADTIIVGGPTHAFGMSRPSTRIEADVRARRAKTAHAYEAHFGADGVREWLARTDLSGKRFAAFDTRVAVPLPHAAPDIEQAAEHAGGVAVTSAASFLVTRHDELKHGELDRARAWARTLTPVPAPQDVRP